MSHTKEDGMLRFALLMLAMAGLAATALADTPNPLDCDVPAGLCIVGRSPLGADPNGRFDVVIRDGAHVPLAGVTVTLALGDCQDVRLCATPEPGLTVDCAQRSVSGVTDAKGRVTLFVIGGMAAAFASRNAGDTAPRCVRVLADGAMIARVPAAVHDLSPTGVGLFSPDLSVWMERFGTGHHFQALDFGFDDFVGVSDFSILLDRFGQGWSTLGCSGEHCP
jgi:hypothetical protein